MGFELSRRSNLREPLKRSSLRLGANWEPVLGRTTRQSSSSCLLVFPCTGVAAGYIRFNYLSILFVAPALNFIIMGNQ